MISFDETAAPAHVVRHPSMMSAREKAYLYHLAAHHFRGDGLIVDAGLFLGASSRAFAAGVKAAGRQRVVEKPIAAYDIAIWRRRMDRHLERPAVQKALKNLKRPTHGQSFVYVLRALLQADMDVIDLKIGDIVTLAKADHPVEIAFYDCLKTYERDFAVFQAFAPKYMPGHTIVLQQDYFYWDAPDHKVRQEFLRDYYEYMGQIKSMAVFRYSAEIPAQFMASDPILALDMDAKLALLEQAAERADSFDSRFETQLSQCMLISATGDVDRAEHHLASLEKGSMGRITRTDRMQKITARMRLLWGQQRAAAIV